MKFYPLRKVNIDRKAGKLGLSLETGIQNSFMPLKTRQAHNNLNHLLKPDSSLMANIEDIKQQAPLFSERLFDQDTFWSSFPEITIKNILTEKVSSWLIREVTYLEIETTLKQMPPDKAPGPDGFNASSIQRNGNLLKKMYLRL